MSTEPITLGEKANFETLRAACKSDDLALVVCETRHLGARVAVVCAMNVEADGTVCPVPLAKMFAGNPYDELRDPTDDMAAASAAVDEVMNATGKLATKEVAMAAAAAQGWNDDTLLSLLFDFCDEHGLAGQFKEHVERVARDEG